MNSLGKQKITYIHFIYNINFILRSFKTLKFDLINRNVSFDKFLKLNSSNSSNSSFSLTGSPTNNLISANEQQQETNSLNAPNAYETVEGYKFD